MYRETARLILRDDRLDEVDAVLAVWTDSRAMKYMGGPKDAAKVRTAFEEGIGSKDPYRFWAIERKDTGRRIGECGLLRKQVDGVDEVELVYVIAPDAWGCGYATEAAAAVRDHAFDMPDTRRLIALIRAENHASVRVARKLGFVKEKSVERNPGVFMEQYACARPASPSNSGSGNSESGNPGSNR